MTIENGTKIANLAERKFLTEQSEADQQFEANALIVERALTQLEFQSLGGIEWKKKFANLILIKCRNWGCYSILDENGDVIVPVGKYSFIDSFESGYARVNKEETSGDKLWGIINTAGEEVVPLELDNIWNFVGRNRTGVRMELDQDVVWFCLKDGKIYNEDPWPLFNSNRDDAITNRIVIEEDYASEKQSQTSRDTFYALTDGMCGDYEDWDDDGYKDYMGF